jgi:hypothetical protein
MSLFSEDGTKVQAILPPRPSSSIIRSTETAQRPDAVRTQ